MTLSTAFYDISVSRNLFSKAEIRKFGAQGTDRLKKGHILLVTMMDQKLKDAERLLKEERRQLYNELNDLIDGKS